jgi:prepilin-type N-terminal cleavage/methylation domain-containing protein
MRSLTGRRGVTLLELMVVLSVFLGCMAAMQALVRLSATQTTAAVARTAAGRDHAALWALAGRELAHASLVDVLVPSSVAVEFDRPIGEGPVCLAHADAVMIRSDHGGIARLPNAGRDRLLGREPTATGEWIGRGIVSVAVANCPDGRPGLLLGVDAAIPSLGFVRFTEPVRLRSYRSGGVYALGLESRVGVASIQPFLGPIDGDGFEAALIGRALWLTFHRAPLVALHLQLPLESAP